MRFPFKKLLVTAGLTALLSSTLFATAGFAEAPPAASICIVAPTVCNVKTISVSLTSSAPSGAAPFRPTLTAKVSGPDYDPNQTVVFTLYCDRNDSGTNITPYAVGKGDAYLAPKGVTSWSVAPCSYANPGSTPVAYYPKVIAQQGGRADVESHIKVAATQATFNVTLTTDPTSAAIGAPVKLVAQLVNGTGQPATLRFYCKSVPNATLTSDYLEEDPALGTNPTVTAAKTCAYSSEGTSTAKVIAYLPGTSTTTTSNAPGAVYEMKSGKASVGAATSVVFDTPFKVKPTSVVATLNYGAGTARDYYITNISTTGFVFHAGTTTGSGTFSWIATSGSIDGSIQSGQAGSGSAVTFPKAFGGDGSDIAVILSRGAAAPGANLLYLDSVSATGFTWSGNGSLAGPIYYLAVRKGVTAAGEADPFVFGGVIAQNSNNLTVNYSNYGFKFSNPTAAAVTANTWGPKTTAVSYFGLTPGLNYNNDGAFYLPMPTASIPSGVAAKTSFIRGGNNATDIGMCVSGIGGRGWNMCTAVRYFSDYWVAMDRTATSNPVLTTVNAPTTIDYATADVSVKSTLTAALTINGQTTLAATGDANFHPTFKVTLGGSATGTASYYMYCNRTDPTPSLDDASLVSTGSVTAVNPDGTVGTYLGVKYTGQVVNGAFSKGPCIYTDPGTYHPMVIVQRGAADWAVSQATIYVIGASLTGPSAPLAANATLAVTGSANLPDYPVGTSYDMYFYCNRPTATVEPLTPTTGVSGFVTATSGLTATKVDPAAALSQPENLCAFADTTTAKSTRMVVKMFIKDGNGVNQPVPGFAESLLPITVGNVGPTPTPTSTPAGGGSTLDYGEGSGSF